MNQTRIEMSHRAQIVSSFFSVFLMRITGMALQIGWFMLLVRLLPVEQVGIYSIIYTLWFLARVLGTFGADIALIRYTPELASQDKHNELVGLHKHIRSKLLLKHGLLHSTVIATLLALNHLGISKIPHEYLIYGSLGVLLYTFNGLQSAKLLSKQQQIQAHFPESIILSTLLIVGGFALKGTEHATLPIILMMQLGICVLVYIIYSYFCVKTYAEKPSTPTQDTITQFYGSARKLFGTLCLNNINTRMPLLFIPVLSNVAAAAYYETANRISSMLSLMQWCTSFVVAPMISSAHANNEKKIEQDILVLSCWLVFIPAFIMFLAIVIFGHSIINVVAGFEYHAAYAPMVLLAFAYLVNATSGPTNHIYMLTGHEAISFKISLMETVLTLISMIVLGSLYGLMGVTIAVTLGLVLRNLLLNVMLFKLTGLYSGIWSLRGIKHALSLRHSFDVKRAIEMMNNKHDG